MSEFKIRSARPGDEAAIHRAHMRSIREVCVKDHGEEEVRGWGNRPFGDRWINAVKTGLVWVVETNGTICGHAYLRIFEADGKKLAHIHGLYLTAEALGKGLGWKLGQLMLGAAKAAHVETVTLESTLTAHPFYKRLGFNDTGPLATVEIGGSRVRYFPMSQRLK